MFQENTSIGRNPWIWIQRCGFLLFVASHYARKNTQSVHHLNKKQQVMFVLIWMQKDPCYRPFFLHTFFASSNNPKISLATKNLRRCHSITTASQDQESLDLVPAVVQMSLSSVRQNLCLDLDFLTCDMQWKKLHQKPS